MGLLRSLSGRLLIVTIVVVMLTEVAIFAPSVARFRLDYLLERVTRAEIAALTVLAAPNGLVSDDLEKQLIEAAEVLNVVVRREGVREMVLMSPDLAPVVQTFDVRDPYVFDLISDAFARLYAGDEGVIRVRAFAPDDMGTELEITLHTKDLSTAMRRYSLNILGLSLVIAIIAAVMVFFAVRRAVVRPITDVISNLKHFSDNPEDAQRIIVPSSRVGEISEAEDAVAEMQREVHGALKARARLASLGEAVAKISHDLRNILATTQLMADRLEGSSDPVVARTSPKLIRSLDRAIRLCQSTLSFGSVEEAPPEPRVVALAHLLDEVVESLGLGAESTPVRCEMHIGKDVLVTADPEHLHRVFSNLLRNASEAILGTGKPGAIRIEAEALPNGLLISLSDTGPGMPAKALEHLFKPFQGGARQGGTGLGLAIAHELIRSNRGELRLAESTTNGTLFEIVFPHLHEALSR